MRRWVALFEVPEEEPVQGLGEGAAEEFGVVHGLFVGSAKEDDVAQTKGLRLRQGKGVKARAVTTRGRREGEGEAVV